LGADYARVPLAACPPVLWVTVNAP
jgi:hypothetical protein